MKSSLTTVLFLVLFSGLRAQSAYVVEDLTAEHLFTTNCEGPAVDRDGNLYVVNFGEDGTIAMIEPDKPPVLFVKLPAGSVGNGIRFNKAGEMFVADFKGHNVLRINIDSKEISVYMHNDRMNQPNDLAVSNAGILYLSDPDWKNSTGQLWKVKPDGTAVLLEKDMGTTNGVEVSPDDKFLYVNESVQKKIWRYDLDGSGDISNKKLFAEFPDYGLDGMRCDEKGNLYVTRYDKGCVAIFSPDGTLLREVQIKGKKTSNVTFGGPDGRTVYVTLQDRGCVEWFRSEFAGAR